MDSIRLPLAITTWRIWDAPQPIMHVYVCLLVLAYTKAHRSPVFGMVCATPKELARELEIEPSDAQRALVWLEQQGYVFRASDDVATWAIACPELFDPGGRVVASYDPATAPNP